MDKHLNDNCVDLIIENDDAKFVKVSKKFLKDLEVQFESFKTNWNDENEKLEKYLNKKNFVFKPEKLAKKSPLTLLNAPWGTGKTYFIENFVKLFIDEEIKVWGI
jgi:SpoVK/Ycf46/Vps4 family AAA+-type ATPase